MADHRRIHYSPAMDYKAPGVCGAACNNEDHDNFNQGADIPSDITCEACLVHPIYLRDVTRFHVVYEGQRNKWRRREAHPTWTKRGGWVGLGLETGEG